MARSSFIPDQGQRAIIVGQTGSGKTAFIIWVAERISHAPVIIYDTKIEPKFDTLVPNVVVHSIEELAKYKDDETVDYIIVRPPDEMLGEPRQLDDFLWWQYQNAHQTTALIDEAATFQINNRAGKGLLSLMQRGRSKGITTIMCTQRPVRIDRSCITEADKAYIFYLADKADKKRIDDIIPNFSDLPKPPKFGFYFFNSGDEEPQLMAPIKLDDKRDTGYIDTPIDGSPSGDGDHTELNSPAKHLWI